MGTCKGCGAAIAWYPNDSTGRLAPVNLDHDDDGNVTLRPNPRGNGFAYHVLAADEDPPEPTARFKLHFATCTKDQVYKRRDPVGRQHQ